MILFVAVVGKTFCVIFDNVYNFVLTVAKKSLHGPKYSKVTFNTTNSGFKNAVIMLVGTLPNIVSIATIRFNSSDGHGWYLMLQTMKL